VRAAPAVSCARCTKKCAHEHTGSAEAIRHSLRNGLTAYAALSPATNSSCHRRSRIGGASQTRSGDFASASLTPATGARTTRFCRTQQAPFVLRAVDRSRGEPALRSRHAPDAAASTASCPASVTIAIRPSLGEDGGASRIDLGARGRGIFSAEGIDGATQEEER
jgi:hypothetical protein